ncbi:DMT family transporter [Paenibacillus rigui]|uniref:EamA family transporter n=1 Tax=Paenibacillus rigui TaxID=554312 RepID=A0A229UJW4_9BACL|nr:DMT family transporter [Paenibacillus rigui]OXM83737.1 EamA family transporter [Paenibacillus rigui]
MGNSRPTSAYAAAVASSLIIGLSFIFVKLALTEADPLDTLAHRFTLSFLAAMVPFAFGWVRLQSSWRDMLRILPLALLYPIAFFAFQAYGLLYATSSEAGIIHATVPILTMLLAAYVLKERSSLGQKLCTFLSVAGVIYIFAMKGLQLQATSMKGILLILISALSLAGYSVLAKKLSQRQIPMLDMTYVVTIAGFLGFNAIAVTRHSFAGTLGQFWQPLTHSTFTLSVFYLGVASSFISIFLSNFALSRLDASKASVFNNLATVVTIVAGVLFLGERLEYFHIVGAIVIVAGVVGSNMLGRRKSPLPKESLLLRDHTKPGRSV